MEHDPFKAIVAPRPIGWISTVDADGCPNLAPYSFFNAICGTPPMVFFSNEKSSDSLANAEATGEFVVNMVSENLAQQMSATSAAVPEMVNEFDLAGVSQAPCNMVAAPRVEGAPASLECKVLRIDPLIGLEGQTGSSTMVIGQVVGVHIRKDLIVDGRFDTAGARLMARCGYLSDYVVVDKLIKMKRPKAT